MKTRKLLLIVSNLIIVLMFLIGCSPAPTAAPTQAPIQTPTQAPTQAPPSMTITFSGDTCAYSGPKSIPYGKFTINVVVEGQGDALYGFTILTLEEGKNLADLQAWPSTATDPPEWIKGVIFNSLPVYKAGKTKQEIDRTYNAAFTGDPIYFVCFATSPERIVGTLGPIEIVK